MPDTDAETDTVTEVEIDDELVHRLRDAQQAYDEVKEYLDSIKDEIKARFADHDHVVGVNAGEQIFDCHKRSSTRINSTRLKRDWPDIWNQYAITKTTTYLSIKRPKVDS